MCLSHGRAYYIVGDPESRECKCSESTNVVVVTSKLLIPLLNAYARPKVPCKYSIDATADATSNFFYSNTQGYTQAFQTKAERTCCVLQVFLFPIKG